MKKLLTTILILTLRIGDSALFFLLGAVPYYSERTEIN